MRREGHLRTCRFCFKEQNKDDNEFSEYFGGIDSLIKMVISPELHRHNCIRWGEDPLESPDGGMVHFSYLDHLAWMIAGYK